MKETNHSMMCTRVCVCVYVCFCLPKHSLSSW